MLLAIIYIIFNTQIIHTTIIYIQYVLLHTSYHQFRLFKSAYGEITHVIYIRFE